MRGDMFDERKLLIFIREEVTTRSPRRGRRLISKKWKRAEVKAQRQKRRRKNRGAEWISGDEKVEHGSDGKAEDDDSSDLFLMYNTVRGYVSAINELWRIQTSKGLQNSPMPVMVTLNVLKASVVRREHHWRRKEIIDRGEATIQDGYTGAQIQLWWAMRSLMRARTGPG